MLSPTTSSLLVSQHLIPLPSSLLGEHLSTSNHTFRRIERKGGRRRKRKPNKKAPASGYHVGHHPPSSSANHDREKVPISSHHDGKKLTNVYHAGT